MDSRRRLGPICQRGVMRHPFVAVCPLSPAQRDEDEDPSAFFASLPQLTDASGPPFVTWARPPPPPAPLLELPWVVEAVPAQLVGRVRYGALTLPAAIFPDRTAHFEFSGTEQEGRDFDVLCVMRGRAEWVRAAEGDVPARGLPACVTSHGETAYVGRARVGNQQLMGRVVPSEGACVAVLMGRRYVCESYEVLVV